MAMMFKLSAPQALVVCMALSLSSTAVVLRLIAERGELKHNTGRLALAILVMQDLVVLPMLAALPVIKRWAASDAGFSDLGGAMTGPNAGSFAITALTRLGGITALILVGRLILPRLLREAARERSGGIVHRVPDPMSENPRLRAE